MPPMCYFQRLIWVKFGGKTLIDVVIDPFGKELHNFPEKGLLPLKPTF